MALKGWADPDYCANLRAARAARGLTQTRVAEEAGIALQYYNDLEHGRRRPSEATDDRIRAVLGVGYEPPREKALREDKEHLLGVLAIVREENEQLREAIRRLAEREGVR